MNEVSKLQIELHKMDEHECCRLGKENRPKRGREEGDGRTRVKT